MLTPVYRKKSIVMIGSFNPSIFQPAWLAAEKLIPASEATEAQIDFIDSGMSAVNFGAYQLLVTLERFQVQSIAEPFFPVIRDLVLGIFGTLSHTPVTKAGINTEVHFRLKNSAQWHRLGHTLAPKVGIWDRMLTKPGLATFTIDGGKPDYEKGRAKITVSPVGGELEHTVSISLNDEYTKSDDALGAREVTKLVEESWDESQKFFDEAVAQLLAIATAQPAI